MGTDKLFEQFYFSRDTYLSGTVQFHNMIAAAAPAHAQILEIGPSSGGETSKFLRGLGEVTGVDVDPLVLSNPSLHHAFVYDGNELPFGDKSFDLCVSDYVLEHVANPEKHFASVARVLRPGGCYVFRTPNLWHYVSLAARILPHRLHVKLSPGLRDVPADTHDPFPTCYRANSARRIKTLAAGAGLSVRQLLMVEKEPSYGRAHALIFYPMMAYERLVNSSEALAFMRVNIFAVLVRE